MVGILLLCVPIAGALYCFLQTRRRKRLPLQNVPEPERKSFITGHLTEVFGPESFSYHAHIKNRFGNVVKLSGLLGDNMLFLTDSRALWNVLIKEADTFDREEEFNYLSRSTFGPGILSFTGEKHYQQRRMLSSVFTSSNIRKLYTVFSEQSNKLVDVLHDKVLVSSDIVDFMDWIGRLSLETIGIAGFGHSFGAFEDRNGEFAHALEGYFPNLSRMQHLMPLLPLLHRVFTPHQLRRAAKAIPWEPLQNMIHITDCMWRHSSEILQNMRKSIESQSDKDDTEGKSLMSAFVDANANATSGVQVDDNEIIAHISTTVFAATDTTTSAIARVLQLLSEYPEAQERLREEVTSCGQLTYDTVNSLPYLDAVVKETLRLHPPVPYVTRRANEDINLPLAQPIKGVNGEDIMNVFVPKDTSVFVNIAGVNREANIWGEDASEWIPDRWLKDLPESVSDAHVPTAYSHLLTFIAGKYTCLGSKFAVVFIKTVIAILISSFELQPSGKLIQWKMGIIRAPYVQDGKEPQLPLRVTPFT